MTLELVLPAVGSAVAADHAYPPYGALPALVPAFHAGGCPLRFAPLRGLGQPDRSSPGAGGTCDGPPRATTCGGAANC